MSVEFDEVSLSNVSRHFGRRRVLNQVSFTVHAGELVGLLGANGAGKSTLLAILATALQPSSGEVLYGASTARHMGPALRSRLGLLAHDLYLYSELSARENLEFFARVYGVTHNVAGLVDRALARAQLERRADDVVANFSRGMRQRLALERTLLHEPRLVLLDEPFTGLDDTASTALVGRLRELRTDRRLVIVATHDLDVAERIIDRAIVLKDGRASVVDTHAGSLRDRYREALG